MTSEDIFKFFVSVWNIFKKITMSSKCQDVYCLVSSSFKEITWYYCLANYNYMSRSLQRYTTISKNIKNICFINMNFENYVGFHTIFMSCGPEWSPLPVLNLFIWAYMLFNDTMWGFNIHEQLIFKLWIMFFDHVSYRLRIV